MRVLHLFVILLAVGLSACGERSTPCEQTSVAVNATTPAAFSLATCAGTNSLRVVDVTTGSLMWSVYTVDEKPLPLRFTYGASIRNTYPSTAVPLVAGREYVVEAQTIVGGDGIGSRTTAQFTAGLVGPL